MNCLICCRVMVNTYGSVYLCQYCGHVDHAKANQSTSKEPRPNSPPNRMFPGTF